MTHGIRTGYTNLIIFSFRITSESVNNISPSETFLCVLLYVGWHVETQKWHLLLRILSVSVEINNTSCSFATFKWLTVRGFIINTSNTLTDDSMLLNVVTEFWWEANQYTLMLLPPSHSWFTKGNHNKLLWIQINKSRNFYKIVLSIKFLKYVIFLIEYTGLCHADWLNFLIQSCQSVWQNVTMAPEVKLRPLFTNYRDAIPRSVVSVASYLCRSIDYNCLKKPIWYYFTGLFGYPCII